MSIHANPESWVALDLHCDQLYTLYCHGPDRQTPIAEQAAAIDQHYKNGEFDYFGVSNLDAQMLQEWLRLADERGYVKPSIYQGQYNLLCRGWEDALFPLLRQHGIKFSGFSPLAGGFLTGKLTFADPVPDSLKGTRFEETDGNLLGKAFRRWYDKPSMHSAMQQLKVSCEREGISMMDASLRWVAYHSGLGEADEMVFGATTSAQIATVANAVADGKLPQALADDINGLWAICKEDATSIIQY
jgi:aflatoxin B1 aldehyde reductase